MSRQQKKNIKKVLTKVNSFLYEGKITNCDICKYYKTSWVLSMLDIKNELTRLIGRK